MPILGLTANTGAAVRRRCLEAGMDQVFGKPYDLPALAAALRRAVQDNRDRARAAGEAPGGEPPLPDAEVARHVDLGVLALLVAEIGAARTRAAVRAFLADLPVRVGRLAEAVPSGADAVARLAEALLDAACALGATTVQAALSNLDDALREGSPAEAEHAVRLLREAAAVTARALPGALAASLPDRGRRAA